MQIVCGHCGKMVQSELGPGETFPCPRCSAKVVVPGLDDEPGIEPSPDDTHAIVEDAEFAEKAREAMSRPQRIAVTCGNCGRLLKVGLRLAGKRARCPSCNGQIRIPWPDEEDEFELLDAESLNVEELDVTHAEDEDQAEAAREAAHHAIDELEGAVRPGADSGGKTPGADEASKALEESTRSVDDRDRRRREKLAAYRQRSRETAEKHSTKSKVLFLVLASVGIWLLVMILAWPLISSLGGGDEYDGGRAPEDGGIQVAGAGSGKDGEHPEPNEDRLLPDANENIDDPPKRDPNHNVHKEPIRPRASKARARVTEIHRAFFGPGGYLPARPGRVYWHVTFQVKAGSEGRAIETPGGVRLAVDDGEAYGALGRPAGAGEVLPRLVLPLKTTLDAGQVAKLTLLFEVPRELQQAELDVAGEVAVNATFEDRVDAPPAGELIGSFAEAHPRNLRPLLQRSVIAAIQQAGPGRLEVTRSMQDPNLLAISVTPSGITGVATPDEQRGVYRARLGHGDQAVSCKLSLLDAGDTVILHFSDRPFHQLTYVRDRQGSGKPVLTVETEGDAKPEGQGESTDRPQPRPDRPSIVDDPHRPRFFEDEAEDE